MVDIADILLKAAEDVQSGMWCKERWFAESITKNREADGQTYGSGRIFVDKHLAARASSMYRCASGSIELATVLLGGDWSDSYRAQDAVEERIGAYLYIFNDDLSNDPFEAGQQLAELFRSTAEAL